MTDYQQAVIWRIPPGGGNGQIWLADPRLDGGPFGTACILLMPDQHTLLFDQASNGGLGGGGNPTTGKLYEVPIEPGGHPGALKQLWESGPADAPDGCALTSSGHVFIALAGESSQIVELDPSGQELARFGQQYTGTNNSSIPFDTPSGLAFYGTQLIIANQSYIAGNTANMALLDLETGEQGSPSTCPANAGLKPASKQAGAAAEEEAPAPPRRYLAGPSKALRTGGPLAGTAAGPAGADHRRHECRPAARPELARDPAGRFGDRRYQRLRRPSRHDPLGVADDPDRPDGVARVVEDRRRDARLAEHRLVALTREPPLADLAELLAQRSRGERPAGQPRQRLGEQVDDGFGGRGTPASPCPARWRAAAARPRPRGSEASCRGGTRGGRPRRSRRASRQRGRRRRRARRAARRAPASAARSSFRSRYELPSWSRPAPSWYLSESRSCSTNPCACRVCSSPWTVGRVRSRRSAISLTPSRRGPLARTFRMRAARSTDWIVARRVGLGVLFGIVESASVV